MSLKAFKKMFVSRVKQRAKSHPDSDASEPDSTITSGEIETSEKHSNKDTNKNPLFGKNSLHNAIENNRMDIVDLLLNRGVDVNTRNNEDMTPLHVASIKGQLTIVEKLLKNGACVKSVISETKTHPGYTPLHCAVQSGSRKITDLLLKNNACVDARTKSGRTSLDIAISLAIETETSIQPIVKNYMSLVKMLLKHGAKIDAYGKFGKRSFHVKRSSICQSTIVAQLFVSCLSDHNKTSRNVLLDAIDASKMEYNETINRAMKNCTNIFLDIVSQRSNNSIDVFIEHFLHTAVEIGCLSVIEDFINFGILVNDLGLDELSQKNFTLLHTAANNKRHEIAKLLIKHGANVNAKDKDRRTPIIYAIENGDRTMTKLLLNKGACIKNNPYLLNNADKVSGKIFEILLRHDSDINAKDENGNTALHLLTIERDEHYIEKNCQCLQIIKAKVAKRLLSKGASANLRNNDGLMPLHVAAKNGYASIVEILLQTNPNVDTENTRSTCSFQSNCSTGSTMNKNNVGINAKNKEGKTPLHLASEQDHERVVKILLDCGADIDYKDHYGKMAIDLAFAGGCRKSFIALLKYGSHFDSANSIDVLPQRWKLMDDRVSLYQRFITNNAYCDYAIKQHTIQMETARNHSRKEEIGASDDGDTTMELFRDHCKKEIEEMEKTKIFGSVSFRDIVTGDVNRLAIYARNKSIVQTLESKDYKKKFPIYCNFIECQFRRGLRRKYLVNHSLDCFNPEIEYSLPVDVLITDIFGLLRNDDLENLIEACEG